MHRIQIEMGLEYICMLMRQWLYLFIWSPLKQAAVCWEQLMKLFWWQSSVAASVLPQDPFAPVCEQVRLVGSAPAALAQPCSTCGDQQFQLP